MGSGCRRFVRQLRRFVTDNNKAERSPRTQLRRHRARLALEYLEDSTVPSSTNLLGGGTGGSTWFINDATTTTNGLPAGGTCSSGANGAGAGVNDASVGVQGDAYDDGSMI